MCDSWGEDGDGVCGTDKCSNWNNPEKRIFSLGFWWAQQMSAGMGDEAPAVKDCNNEKHLMSYVSFLLMSWCFKYTNYYSNFDQI